MMIEDMHERALAHAHYIGSQCHHREGDVRCDSPGAYYLHTGDKRVPSLYCYEHAAATVNEYLDMLGWTWYVIPIHHKPAEAERSLYLTPHQNAEMGKRVRAVSHVMWSAGFGYRGGSELHRGYDGGGCDHININVARKTAMCVRHGYEVVTIQWPEDINLLPDRIAAIQWVAKAPVDPQLALFEGAP